MEDLPQRRQVAEKTKNAPWHTSSASRADFHDTPPFAPNTPLQQLAELGVAVLVLHHPKKGEPAPGQAARGSGALGGCVDILIEMAFAGEPGEDDRRRKLRAFSRHPATPPRLVIELNAEATDYLVHGDFRDQDDANGWDVLRGVLEDSSYKLSRRSILERWPTDFRCPEETTLGRWLDKALAQGQVKREGAGRKNAPYLYWLTGQEELWALDPFPLVELEPLESTLDTARRLLAEQRRVQAEIARIEEE